MLAASVSYSQTIIPAEPPSTAGRAAPISESSSQFIDLPTALRLATTSNLDIAQARLALDQARAARQLARSVESCLTSRLGPPISITTGAFKRPMATSSVLTEIRYLSAPRQDFPSTWQTPSSYPWRPDSSSWPRAPRAYASPTTLCLPSRMPTSPCSALSVVLNAPT